MQWIADQHPQRHGVIAEAVSAADGQDRSRDGVVGSATGEPELPPSVVASCSMTERLVEYLTAVPEMKCV
jgi:hypothetical protein